MIGEMIAGIYMKVLGSNDVLVSGVTGQVGVYCRWQSRSAGHRYRAALAEIVLHVDDDQRPHTPHDMPVTTGPAVCGLARRVIHLPC